MPNAMLAPVDVPASAHLKTDIEASGERELARLEIAALLGRPIRGLADDDVIDLGDVTADEAELLQRRLAFTDSISVGGRALRCWQADLESAHTPLADHRNGGAISSRTRRRNEYLTHGFHKYKAKFFPRMARALVNITCGAKGSRVLDPFVGSGTTLIEAGMMGLDSVGVDLDPLSVFIASAKVEATAEAIVSPDLANRLLAAALEAPESGRQLDMFAAKASARRYTLPAYIRSKVEDSVATDIEEDVTAIRAYVGAITDHAASSVARLALSHAVATKLNLRWMGTGDNRFSLSVHRTPVARLFKKHLTVMAGVLAKLSPASAQDFVPGEVMAGSALDIPFVTGLFDGIVTSPPYLPASSGRETYLRSRGPSLIALELMTEVEILEHEASMMGSVLNQGAQMSTLPSSIVDLVDWMKPQRARAPKAAATARYFVELRKALDEMGRVLKPGGRAAVVLAGAHTFYDLISRDTVRVLNMPDTVLELLRVGNPSPLRHIATVTMDLAKMDFAARPGARGGYSEAILLFERI